MHHLLLSLATTIRPSSIPLLVEIVRLDILLSAPVDVQVEEYKMREIL